MLTNYKEEQHLYSEKEYFLKYYEIISVEAYYAMAMIIFILYFSLVHPEKINHYHLYSIPAMTLTTIIPPKHYLTLNTELYQYSMNPFENYKDIRM